MKSFDIIERPSTSQALLARFSVVVERFPEVNWGQFRKTVFVH